MGELCSVGSGWCNVADNEGAKSGAALVTAAQRADAAEAATYKVTPKGAKLLDDRGVGTNES